MENEPPFKLGRILRAAGFTEIPPGTKPVVIGMDMGREPGVTAFVVDPPYGFSAAEFAERNRAIVIGGRRQGKSFPFQREIAAAQRDRARLERANRLIAKGGRRKIKRAVRLYRLVRGPRFSHAEISMRVQMAASARTRAAMMARIGETLLPQLAESFQRATSGINLLSERLKQFTGGKMYFFPDFDASKLKLEIAFPGQRGNTGEYPIIQRHRIIDADIIGPDELESASDPELERAIALKKEEEFRRAFLDGFGGKTFGEPYQPPIVRCDECGLPMQECNRRARRQFDREAFQRFVRAERRINASKG